MAVCPFAVKKLIPPGSNDPAITPTVAVLHVDGGGALSLFTYFRDRSGGVESHFHITWWGRIEQYRDTGYEADANYLANPFAVSIETQGFGGGKWNYAQRRAIKRLLLWLHEVHGIPLRPCPAWDAPGVGYHTMWGAPGKWTPVAKSCPGPQRILQFHEWLMPWMKSLLVPTPVEVFRKAVRAALIEFDAAKVPETRTAAHRMAEACRVALRSGPRR